MCENVPTNKIMARADEEELEGQGPKGLHSSLVGRRTLAQAKVVHASRVAAHILPGNAFKNYNGEPNQALRDTSGVKAKAIGIIKVEVEEEREKGRA